MPSFTDTKNAFIYVRLPPGNFPALAKEIVDAIETRIQSASYVITPHLTLGGADLLIRLDLPNYRAISDIQQALVESRAEATSWLFSVPYESEVSADLDAAQPLLHFVTQLRVRRAVYSTYGVDAEDVVVRNLWRLAEEYKKSISLEIMAGLGWADLVLVGKSECEQDKVLEFILHARELKIPFPKQEEDCQDKETGVESQYLQMGQPIFQRSITTLGFEYQRHGDSQELKGLMPDFPIEIVSFVRTRPGFFYEAFERTQRSDIPAKSQWIGSVDGTYDLACLFLAAPESFGEIFHAGAGGLASSASAENDISNWPIERSRSHILVGDPSKINFRQEMCNILDVEPKSLRPESTPNLKDLRFLSSLTGQLARNSIGDSDSFGILPKSLKRNIQWLLGLLRGTLSDIASYSDAHPAIHNCISWALAYVEELETIRIEAEASQNPLGVLRTRHQRIRALRSSLEIWCRYIPRILTERAAGRFGDLFGDGSHFFASIGGLQKTLLLADLLAAEFLDDAITALCPSDEAIVHKVDGRSSVVLKRRMFVAVFDNVDGIRSFPEMGIIRLPLRHRFSLPRITTGIWHEIAQSIFAMYFPDSDESSQKIKEIALNNERSGGNKAGWSRIPLARLARDLSSTAGNLDSIDWADRLFQEVTEIFSDALLNLVGFRFENIELFQRELCVATFEDILATEKSSEEKERLMASLLLRLLVSEMFFESSPSKPVDLYKYSNMSSLGELSLAPPRLVISTIYVASQPRYRNTWFRTSLFRAISDGPPDVPDIIGSSPLFWQVMGGAIALLRHPAFIEILSWFLEPLRVPIAYRTFSRNRLAQDIKIPLEQGKVCPIPEGRLNDYYLSLSLKDLDAFLKSDARATKADRATTLEELADNSTAKERAALARSAICSFYSRQNLDREGEGE